MAKEDYKGIWIFAEQQNGVLNSVTLELLAKAQELKAHNGEDIYAILLGSDVKALAPTLIAHGADKVIVAEDAALASYSARPYQQAMTQLAEKYKPSIILYGATSLGRDFAPRVMVSLKTGLTADAIDLGYDEDDVFYQTTPAYGGSILAHELFQGGHHTFPMEKAEKEFGFEVPGFEDVDCCVVRYPMTVLRLNSANKQQL